MAELYMLAPLFPGSSPMDQMAKICKILGVPSANDWQDGHILAQKIGYTFPNFAKQSLRAFIKDASPEALSLIEVLYTISPP
jgi:hypothetical protein